MPHNYSSMSIGTPFFISKLKFPYDKYSVDKVWTKIYRHFYFRGITLTVKTCSIAFIKYFSKVCANGKGHNCVYVLSSKPSYRPMSERIAAQLFYNLNFLCLFICSFHSFFWIYFIIYYFFHLFTELKLPVWFQVSRV